MPYGGSEAAAVIRVCVVASASLLLRYVCVFASVLRGRVLGRSDPDPLCDRGGVLGDPVDGGGVHDGAVHGRAVDLVESHDFEAHCLSLRRAVYVVVHGLRVTNIPYAKEIFRTANY